MGVMRILKKPLKTFKNLSNPKKLMVLIIGYFLSIYVYSLLNWMYWNTSSYILEGFGTPKKFIFFHMNTCGYCKDMMGEWNSFVSSNTSSIKTEKIEKSENPELLSKYNVKGFPTLLLIDEKGKSKKYEGGRTAKEFNNFVNSHQQ